MPDELEMAYQKRRKEILEMTAQMRQSLAQEVAAQHPSMAPEDHEAAQNVLRTFNHFSVIDRLTEFSEKQGATEAANEFREVRRRFEAEAQQDEQMRQRTMFDASKGGLLDAATTTAIAAKKGLSAAVPFLGTVAEGVGEKAAEFIPTGSGHRYSRDDLRAAEQGAVAGMEFPGRLAVGFAESIGGIKGFMGAGKVVGKMGEAFKRTALAKGNKGAELAGRFLLSNVGNFAVSSTLLNLGESGALAANGLVYGSPDERMQALEHLKTAPLGALNSGILGAFMPAFARAGRGVSRRLVDKWLPGVSERVKLLDDVARLEETVGVHGGRAGRMIGIGAKNATEGAGHIAGREAAMARLAQGVGGMIEFFPMAALPHIGEEGITIFEPFRKALFGKSDEEVQKGWEELLINFLSGAVVGAAKKHVEYNDPQGAGTFLQPKPKDLPVEVQHAIRLSAREAVEAMGKEAFGDPEALQSILQTVALREHMGYEPRGTLDALLAEGQATWGAEQAQRQADYHKKIEAQSAADYDKAKPRDVPVYDSRGEQVQSGLLQPGMGIRTKEEAAELGLMPFMAVGGRKPNDDWKPSEWDPRLRRDLTDKGTEIEVNVGTRANPHWVNAVVQGPKFRRSEGEQQKMKGVIWRSEEGTGMFTVDDVRSRLVRMRGSKIGERVVRPPLSQKRANAAEESQYRARKLEEVRLQKQRSGPPRIPDTEGQRKLDIFKPIPPKKPDAPIISSPGATGETASPPVSDRPIGELFGKGTGVNRRSKAAPEPKPDDGEMTGTTRAVAERVGLLPTAPAAAPFTKPKRPKLGAGAGPRGTDRRREVVPVAVDRRKVASERRKVRDEANTDADTKLGNRRYFHSAMQAVAGRPDLLVRVWDGTNLKAGNDHRSPAFGDKLILGWADKLREAARAVGLRESAIFRVGGDEYAAIGTEKQLRQMADYINKNGLLDHTEINGLKFEHRLVSGESKATYDAAAEDQKAAATIYKDRAEKSGLGVYRKAGEAKAAPAAEAPKAAPAPSEPPKAAPQPRPEAAAKDARANVAREALLKAGVPAEKITDGPGGTLWPSTAKLRAGHIYDPATDTWSKPAAPKKAAAPFTKTPPAQDAEGKASPSAEAKAPAQETSKGPQTATDILFAEERHLEQGIEIIRQAATEDAEARRSDHFSEEHAVSLGYLEERIKAIRKLRTRARKMQGSMPRVHTRSMPLPKNGEYVRVRDVSGEVVTGVVENADDKGVGLGRRLVLIQGTGKSRRVRMNDIVDVAPADIYKADWGRGVEVSPLTLGQLIAGRTLSQDGPESIGEQAARAAEARTQSEIELRERHRKHTITNSTKRIAKIQRGVASVEEAKEEALKGRAARIKAGEHTADDLDIEAAFYLAEPANRARAPVSLGRSSPQAERAAGDFEMERIQRLEDEGSISIEERQALETYSEEIGLDLPTGNRKSKKKNVVSVGWYDPSKPLRRIEDIEAMAKEGSPEARLDAINYRRVKGGADAKRALEKIEEDQAQKAADIGPGFRVLRGDIDKNEPIILSLGADNNRNTNLFVAEPQDDSGNYIVRSLTPKEILADKELKDIADHDARWRHQMRVERMEQAHRDEVIGRATQIGVKAYHEISLYMMGSSHSLPEGDIYDRAKAWLKANPRPIKDTVEYQNWYDRMKDEITPRGRSGSGGMIRGEAVAGGKHVRSLIEESAGYDPTKTPDADTEGETIGTLLRERAESYRDPVTDKLIEPQTPGGVTLGMGLGGVTTDTLNVGKRLMRTITKPIGGSIRLGADIGEAVISAALTPIRNTLFRLDTLPGYQSLASRDNIWGEAIRSLAHHGRLAEASLMPGGGSNGPRVRTLANQHNGELEMARERIEEVLADIKKIPHERMVKIIQEYADNEDPNRAVPRELQKYDAFMREMASEMIRVGLAKPGDLDRFLGRYIHYGIFKWTRGAVMDRIDALREEGLLIQKRGGDASVQREGVEFLQKWLRDNHNQLGVSKYVPGQVPLQKIGDKDTNEMIRGGYLRYRGFKSFQEAVDAGFDTSNPAKILVDAMHLEAQAVAKQRMFDAIVSDPNLSVPTEKAPSWYTPISDQVKLAQHNAWNKLKGRSVDPFLFDQLTMLEHKPSMPIRILNLIHGATKAQAALTDFGTVLTNILGNPMVLAAQGMPVLTAYGEYLKAFGQLLVSDPMFGKHLQNTTYGKQRPFYLRQGWVSHLADEVREFQELVRGDKGLRSLILKAAAGGEEGSAKEMLTDVINRLSNYGDKGIRVYRLLDAAARAALHEWNVKKGMSETESIDAVNTLFDVEHMPKAWRAVRAGVGGIGAWSFSSFPAAMSRSLPKILGAGPVVVAQLYALQQLYTLGLSQVYGVSQEEIEDQIDQSLPITGNAVYDQMVRMTAVPVMESTGLKVYSATKYMPQDAVLDLLPGMKAAALGGRDERGMSTGQAFMSGVLGRSVVSGPIFSWLLNRDPMTGAPVRDRYDDDLVEFLREKQGFPLQMIPALGTAFRKQVAFNRATGRAPPFIRVSVKSAKPDENGNMQVSGVKSSISDMSDAWQNVFGLNGREPDALQRHIERARAHDDRVAWNDDDGGFKPATPLHLATPARASEEASTVSRLNNVRKIQKGLRLWASFAHYDNLVKQKAGEEALSSAKNSIVRLIKAEEDLKDYADKLALAGEADKAQQLVNLAAIYQLLPRKAKVDKAPESGKLLTK